MIYEFVDIKKHFNNKLFVYSENCILENVGEVFDATSIIKCSEYNDIKFDLSNIYIDDYDSIACEEQQIDINTHEYNNLAILATAFWDCYHEKIQIIDANKEKKQFSFDVPNTQNIANHFDYDTYTTKTAFSCYEFSKKYSRYLYVHLIPVEYVQQISIVLPYNPSILVSAMTLIRV